MYRKLTPPEIANLEQNGCRADDWQKVTVRDGFDPDRLRNVHLSGTVQLGSFTKTVDVNKTISKSSWHMLIYLCNNCFRICSRCLYITNINTITTKPMFVGRRNVDQCYIRIYDSIFEQKCYFR